MRLRILVVMTFLVWAGCQAEAQAQSQGAQGITTVIISGRCQLALVNSKPVRCGPNTRLVYDALPNGIVMINVALADGRILAFVGDHDRQPRPEEYWLHLTRVRMGTSGQSLTTDVAATCKMFQTTDASVVHSVKCEATDLSGSHIALDFRGNGSRVDVSQR